MTCPECPIVRKAPGISGWLGKTGLYQCDLKEGGCWFRREMNNFAEPIEDEEAAVVISKKLARICPNYTYFVTAMAAALRKGPLKSKYGA